jgi:catechol 2,3-dioxygenase-like lactoylglutathione lyase family enzyme
MTTPQMQKASPNIYVTDIHETIDFYRKFGFELTTQLGEGGDAGYRRQAEKSIEVLTA